MAQPTRASQTEDAMFALVRRHIRRMTPTGRGRLCRTANVVQTHFYAWLRGPDGRNDRGCRFLSIAALDRIMLAANLRFAPPRLVNRSARARR